MSTQCAQTLASGEPCHAPAISTGSRCRHHDPERPRKAARESQPLNLPPLVNKTNLLAAITEVLSAMGERRIKRSEGGTLLYGLQLAGRLMTELDQTIPNSYLADDSVTPPAEPVEDLPSPKPNRLSEPVTEFGRMRKKLEAEGHVFFTPTAEDQRKMMALLDKGKVNQLTELYMAKHSAWQTARAASRPGPCASHPPEQNRVPHPAGSNAS